MLCLFFLLPASIKEAWAMHPNHPAGAEHPQHHLLVRRWCRDCRLPERAQLQQCRLLQQQQRCRWLREEVPRGPGLHRLPLVWLRFLPRLDCHHWPEHSWRCEHPCRRYPPWPGYEPGLKSQWPQIAYIWKGRK